MSQRLIRIIALIIACVSWQVFARDTNQVESLPRLSSNVVFYVEEAPYNELSAATSDDATVVLTHFGTIAIGSTVGIHWVGATTYDSPIRTVVYPTSLRFKIPKDRIIESAGRTVRLTYSYKVGGAGSPIISEPLNIKVVVVSPGQLVVARLNERYNNTANSCSGDKAAFFCNGVIIRVTDASHSFHAWDPSPGAIQLGGVSFSYIRKDLDARKFQGGRTQGLILTEASAFGASGLFALQVLCSFPYDAGTLSRSDRGCGAHRTFPTNSTLCSAQGITTLAAWRTHFNTYPTTNENRYRHQCGFTTTQPDFALSLSARENPAAEIEGWRQNEIMIATWPQNTQNLPLEAIFYLTSINRWEGLSGAQFIQWDYFQTTGKRVPIVRLTSAAGVTQVFSFHLSDQNISLSTSE